MTVSSLDRQILLHRARREAAQGNAQLAHALFLRALPPSTTGAEGDARALLLHEMLDLCEDYFDRVGQVTEQTAQLLLELRPAEARAQKLLGTAFSFRSRDARWQNPEAALELAEKARAHLEQATALEPFDADAWGTLGGLYKRLATWSDKPEESVRFRKKMLTAYKTGMDKSIDAYPLLNYLEQRALAAGQEGVAIWQADDDELRERLDQALRIRERQFRRGVDRPWAAFDLARGKHYLVPNVPRFLADLEVGLADARQEARTAADRRMVVTTRDSLQTLLTADVALEGLDDGIVLLTRGIEDDRWLAGHWGPEGRPPDYLAPELESALAPMRAALEKLNQSVADTSEHTADSLALQRDLADKLRGFLAERNRRWSEADEARFQKEIPEILEKCEPRSRKVLRILWKTFGKSALAAGIRLIPLPGAKTLASIVS